MNVLSGAPYGYLYIRKHEGGGQARYEILLEEARVVRQVFDWIGRDRASIGDVVRRLTAAGEHTRGGKTVWDRSTVWGILKNPAYKGTAAFGKTRAGEMRPHLRTQRGRPAQPRRAVASVDVPATEWIGVPVPALVSEELFATVQEQLAENRQRARQGQREARYLLQGLVCCALCGYAYYGKAISPSAAKHHPRHYAYYRCIGNDAYRFGGHRLCQNKQVRTDLVDLAVWAEVRTLLEHPERLLTEYQRRLQDSSVETQRTALATVETQLRKLRQGVGRLIDSYAEGLIEKSEFEPRIARLKERVAALDVQATDLAAHAAQESDLRLIIGHLEDFALTLRDRLDQLDWEAQRGIIRTLVKRVEIEQGQVNVVFRIGPGPLVSAQDPTSLPHCGRGGDATLRRAVGGWVQGSFCDHTGFEPPFDGASQRWIGLEFVQKRLVGDGVEAAADVRIKQILALVTDHRVDGFHGIVGRASWAEPIAVCLKPRFPFWLQGEFDQRLVSAVEHHRQT